MIYKLARTMPIERKWEGAGFGFLEGKRYFVEGIEEDWCKWGVKNTILHQ